MCILDLSKYLMYDFHYNYIKKKHDSNAKLMFTDTDSLLYKIKTDNFYEDIKLDNNKLFDTSKFSVDHASGIETGINKKVVGKFKSEAGAKDVGSSLLLFSPSGGGGGFSVHMGVGSFFWLPPPLPKKFKHRPPSFH